jgi:ribosomal protein S18 acetylase RimI-like enzyme
MGRVRVADMTPKQLKAHKRSSKKTAAKRKRERAERRTKGGAAYEREKATNREAKAAWRATLSSAQKRAKRRKHDVRYRRTVAKRKKIAALAERVAHRTQLSKKLRLRIARVDEQCFADGEMLSKRAERIRRYSCAGDDGMLLTIPWKRHVAAGYVTIKIADTKWRPGKRGQQAYIARLGVAKIFQRKSLASALLEAAKQLVCERLGDGVTLSLIADASRDDLYALYSKAQFVALPIGYETDKINERWFVWQKV